MPSSATTGRDSEKFNLRLPDGMRERIADAAKENGRSMNSEIIARLEASFDEGGLSERFSELEKRLDRLATKLEGA
jgi:predicted DNA-binding protein